MPQQFIVPQFIDVEDKIIGPITVRQFVILVIALVIVFVQYRLLKFMVFLPFGVLTFGLAGLLAFAKVNGRPIHYFLLNYIQTIKRPFVRVWDKEAYVRGVQEVVSEIKEEVVTVRQKSLVNGSKLQELSLLVNTGGVYQTQEDILNDNIPMDLEKNKLELKK